MRIVLLGLTGYTNEILPAIVADPRLELCAVFTRRYDTPYPYYSIPQIHEVCGDLGIPCHTNIRIGDGPGFDLLRGYEPDLILMTGFGQILTPPVLDLPPLGVVNVHPSLLPRYRGADPTQAVLLEGALETGVTFHYAVPEVDAGNILLRSIYPIATDETNASLRLGLARLAAKSLPQLIDLFADGTRPPGTVQRGEPSSGERRYAEQVALSESLDLGEVDRIVRAVVPFPGATVRVQGVDRVVRGSTLLQEASADPPIDEERQIVWERKGVRLVLTFE